MATFNGIQIGGVNVNPGANGIAKLGDAIASGPAQMAQAQQRGMYLGAQTADAIAQARTRQQEFESRNTIADGMKQGPIHDTLANLGIDEGSIALGSEQVRGGMPLGDNVVASMLKNKYTAAIGGANPTPASAASALAPGAAIGAVKTDEKTGAYSDPTGITAGQTPFHGTPEQLAATQASTAEQNASAGLKTKETEHPELFHPSMGVMPSQMNMNDPAWAAHVQAVASGAVAPTPSSGRTAGMAVAEQRDVMALNPNFKGFHYAAAAREASTVEGGQQGVTTDQSINRVGQHLGVYEQLVKDMDNGETRPGNVVSNYISKQFGGAAPTNVTLASHILGTEIIKSMANVNAGSKEERNTLQEQFDTAASQ